MNDFNFPYGLRSYDSIIIKFVIFIRVFIRMIDGLNCHNNYIRNRNKLPAGIISAKKAVALIRNSAILKKEYPPPYRTACNRVQKHCAYMQ